MLEIHYYLINTLIVNFGGFEIFDSGIFLGRKIWQVFFRDFWGITDLRCIVLRIKHDQRKCSWVSLVL